MIIIYSVSLFPHKLHHRWGLSQVLIYLIRTQGEAQTIEIIVDKINVSLATAGDAMRNLFYDCCPYAGAIYFPPFALVMYLSSLF